MTKKKEKAKDIQIAIPENPPQWEDKDFLLAISCSIFLFCLQSAFNPFGGSWDAGDNAGFSIAATTTTRWESYLLIVIILTVSISLTAGQIMLLAMKLPIIATSNSRGLVIFSIRVVLGLLLMAYVVATASQVPDDRYYEVLSWVVGLLVTVFEVYIYYFEWFKTFFSILVLTGLLVAVVLSYLGI